MKKSFFSLIVIAVLGIASQSCETTSGLEEVVIQQSPENVSPAQDVKTKPGGGD